MALKITNLNTILCPFDYEILSFHEQIHGSYKQIFTECLLVLGPARILLHPMQVKPWPNASIVLFSRRRPHNSTNKTTKGYNTSTKGCTK